LKLAGFAFEGFAFAASAPRDGAGTACVIWFDMSFWRSPWIALHTAAALGPAVPLSASWIGALIGAIPGGRQSMAYRKIYASPAIFLHRF